MSKIFNFLFSKREVVDEEEYMSESDDSYDSSCESECSYEEYDSSRTSVVTEHKIDEKVYNKYPKTTKTTKKNEKCYDPKLSNASEITVKKFVESRLSKDLKNIPGVGKKNAIILREDGIEAPVQLIAVYLAISGETDDTVDMSNMFYNWLQDIGVNSNRNTIVQVVAKKANSWMPGIYDGDAYAK